MASVHADDPRIAVAAFFRSDTAHAGPDPNTLVAIPVDPVGATMEFFRAGMPTTSDWPALAESNR